MRIPSAAAALVLAACASSPPPLPPPRWIPPPGSATCTDAHPCETVKRWFEVETEAALAWPACHPVPLRGSEAECARADAAYAKVHRERLEYVAGLCGGAVGSNAWTIRPFLGTPENDRIVTCGGKGDVAPFTCRLWEWTWSTPSKGGAFVVFLVQPTGAPPGVWAVNSCSYCEAGGACQDFTGRR